MSVRAYGNYYFRPSAPPVTALCVRTGKGEGSTHLHDLTQEEHFHDFIELVIVADGKAVQWLENEEYTVQRGDIYILQPRHRHYFHSYTELNLINIMYDPDKVQLPLDELRRMPGYSAFFMLEPQYRHQHQFAGRLHLGPVDLKCVLSIAGRMLDETHTPTAGSGALLISKLLEMIVLLARLYTNGPGTEHRALLRLGTIISTLEEHYQEPWNVETLAAKAHMSCSQFIRVFQRATGQTPIRYLLNRRLAQAMTELSTTDKTITEIAMEVGFSDSNYFTRQFKLRMGQTPGTWRDLHR